MVHVYHGNVVLEYHGNVMSQLGKGHTCALMSVFVFSIVLGEGANAGQHTYHIPHFITLVRTRVRTRVPGTLLRAPRLLEYRCYSIQCLRGDTTAMAIFNTTVFGWIPGT
jgi:hypothetical protein